MHITTTVAGVAASIMAGLFLSVPPASADTTVDQWQDPGSQVSAQGTVRQADMADAHRPSELFEPQGAQELDAIGQSWGKSFCRVGETSHGTNRIGAMHDDQHVGSERCQDRGR